LAVEAIAAESPNFALLLPPLVPERPAARQVVATPGRTQASVRAFLLAIGIFLTSVESTGVSTSSERRRCVGSRTRVQMAVSGFLAGGSIDETEQRCDVRHNGQ
jgi:hypothetical protein